MKREAAADKLLLLGIDGLDPRLTKKYMEMGLMPNMKAFVERGAGREDMVMLGGHPTVTPPMWTTLACGCYVNVHGITGFYRKSPVSPAHVTYNLDSRNCEAEQLWNVFAEAGKKTLVFHWPGSSWPPTSDNPNLMVIDGCGPNNINAAVAQVEMEFLVKASVETQSISYKQPTDLGLKAVCVVEGMEEAIASETGGPAQADNSRNLGDNRYADMAFYIDTPEKQATCYADHKVDESHSPIKDAVGWVNAPEGAKEFTMLLSKGMVRRPALILRNEEGNYDRVALYKNKKEAEPFAVLELGKYTRCIFDEAIVGDKKYPQVYRDMKLLRLDPEATSLIIWVSPATDSTNDSVWHPKRLFKEVVENVGYTVPTCNMGDQNAMFITECMLENWDMNLEWQSAAIHHLIEKENLDIVFSHFHNIDLEEHMFIRNCAERSFNRNPVEVAEGWLRDVYIQTDRYIGKFLHFLDEGWTMIIFSDHAQVASKHSIPMLLDAGGTTIPLMEQMGYLTPIRDENGNVTGIDWSKTKAVIQREGHLYINLKGRDPEGIVEPEDKYELEEQIMTDLYKLTSPETGHRIVALALRNKDAVLLGQGGPHAGDIMVWHAEGYNYDHEDCLSTTLGECDTSVSPFFYAAGKGIKEGFTTSRIIREIDFAPTVAVLGGVRMPANCEGAPVYQILAEEY